MLLDLPDATDEELEDIRQAFYTLAESLTKEYIKKRVKLQEICHNGKMEEPVRQ